MKWKELVLVKDHPMKRVYIEKVVVNIGVGTGGERLEKAANLLRELTGAEPSLRRAKRSIKDFGIRKGEPIGVAVTLRRDKAVEFLMTDADIQIPGTTTIFYKRYTGTGSPNDSPIYEIQVPHLAGWFYQECPGMLDRVEVGAGVDLGKLILRKAAQAGKVVAERFAKVIELVGVDVAWTSGTNFFVVLGGLRFDAPSGKQFDLYFYTTQYKVEIPWCGQVDLPFLYAEFR